MGDLSPAGDSPRNSIRGVERERKGDKERRGQEWGRSDSFDHGNWDQMKFGDCQWAPQLRFV